MSNDLPHFKPFRGGWLIMPRRPAYPGEPISIGVFWPRTFVRRISDLTGYFAWCKMMVGQ